MASCGSRARWLPDQTDPIRIRSSATSTSDFRNLTARPILKYGTSPATRGLALRGVFLERLIRRAIDGSEEPTCQGTAELVPQELLKLAREWKKTPAAVIARLAATVEKSD